MLEVARAAARVRSAARREMRERVLRQRMRLRGTLGLGNPIWALCAPARKKFLDEQHRAVAVRSRPTGLDRPPRLRRGSPFPDAPKLEMFKVVKLDTATFIGPPLDVTGSNYRNLVVPNPPAPGRNFARAFAELESGHQFGFDPGHLNGESIDFYFAFTANNDVRVNAMSFVDWNGGYTLFAGWYPFDNSWAETTFTLGMDVFVVDPQGALVGTISATPDHVFDKRLDVGLFDFVGAYDSFTYSGNSDFFVNGLEVKAANRVFFRIWADFVLSTKSYAYAQVDFDSGDLGIDVTGAFAITFPLSG
jgi:hypothetical protein